MFQVYSRLFLLVPERQQEGLHLLRVVPWCTDYGRHLNSGTQRRARAVPCLDTAPIAASGCFGSTPCHRDPPPTSTCRFPSASALANASLAAPGVMFPASAPKVHCHDWHPLQVRLRQPQADDGKPSNRLQTTMSSTRCIQRGFSDAI